MEFLLVHLKVENYYSICRNHSCVIRKRVEFWLSNTNDLRLAKKQHKVILIYISAQFEEA
jgi:hypothetical protein